MSKSTQVAIAVDKAITTVVVLAAIGKLIGFVDLSWAVIMLPVFAIWLLSTTLKGVGTFLNFVAR